MGVGGYYIARIILLNNILQIEQELVENNISRVRFALNEEIRRFKPMALDWAQWDETYDFTKDLNYGYIHRNLSKEAFISNQWSYFLIYTLDHKLIYDQGFNMATAEDKPVPVMQMDRYFYPKSFFFNAEVDKKPAGGMILVDKQLQFAISLAIKPSDRLGNSRGYLILIRSFTQESLLNLSKNLGLNLQINYGDNAQIWSEELLKNTQQIIIKPEVIAAKLVVKDVLNKPIAVISFTMKRNIYLYNKKALNFFLLLLGITGLISLIALVALINHVILRRVALFNHQLTKIAKKRDYSKHLEIQGQDELASMAEQVNVLLMVIRKSYQSLKNKVAAIKEINKDLKKLELEKRNIIDYAPEPIIITAINNRITIVNQAAQRIFGCDYASIHNQNIDDVFQIMVEYDSHKREKVPISNFQQINIKQNEQYFLVYHDKLFPVELKKAAINDGYFVYILRDISTRKLYEKEVAQLNQKLVISSREAGMSDVSRMLLHNIGNILNGVSVTVSLLAEEVRTAKFNNIIKISKLLSENKQQLSVFLSTDDKGKKIPDYILLLAEDWQKERKKMGEQLYSLQESIEKIMTVIKNFQFKNTATIAEEVDVIELMDSVINIYLGKINQLGIKIIKDYQGDGYIKQDRFKIWHILNNLINNAIDALKISEPTDPYIKISIEKDSNRLKISVKDNGSGIAPDRLVSIFLFRHTSKPDGHGIGLHSSSILATEIGAKLSVHSEGINKGATFILELSSFEQSGAVAAESH